MTVEQLGLVTMYPHLPRPASRPSSSAKCSAFTSGMSSGTDSSRRCAEELLTTANPARAKAVSASPATSAGRLEKTTSQSSGGRGACTTSDRTAVGMSPGRRHVHASAYGRPCDRSEAASAVTTNWGCSSSMAMKR